MFDGDGASARYYDQMRRRRRWSINGRNGYSGYASYLAGFEGDDGLSSIIGAETAAFEPSSGSDASRAVLIGVATGALTFLVNRWLGKVLG